jgi:hypothetical protein
MTILKKIFADVPSRGSMNKLLYPFVAFWYGLGAILNAISSRVILTLIFFLIVTPVAFIRRLSGADALKLKQFKKDSRSVMVVRDHEYKAGDFENTF